MIRADGEEQADGCVLQARLGKGHQRQLGESVGWAGTAAAGPPPPQQGRRQLQRGNRSVGHEYDRKRKQKTRFYVQKHKRQKNKQNALLKKGREETTHFQSTQETRNTLSSATGTLWSRDRVICPDGIGRQVTSGLSIALAAPRRR